MKKKKVFNPDDFNIDLKVKDVVEKFPQLKELNYQEISLNDELVKLNYEIISKDYKDFLYVTIEQYYEFEVDFIV